jgi:hypothetical protein
LVLSSPPCSPLTSATNYCSPIAAGVIRRSIAEVLAANPETGLLEIETALRHGAAQAYLIASGAGLSIVFGFPAWRAALDKVGRTPEQNRQALAGEPIIRG